MISAEETLGWSSTPASVRCSWILSGPCVMPQPSPCGNATTPSTLGGRASFSKLCAICSDGVGRAIAGRDHRDVIARSGASVLALVAEKRRDIRGGVGIGDLALRGTRMSVSSSWNERLCTWTCCPVWISRVARPMRWP